MNILEVSKRWQYSPKFNIEFGCGMCVRNGEVYITFSEDDSAAMLLRMPVDKLLG